MTEQLYQWKDILSAIFNWIDTNHSGSINRNEFAEIIQFLIDHEKIDDADIDVEELTNALDLDGSGGISFDEFLRKNQTSHIRTKSSLISFILEGFQLVKVK